MKLTLLGLNKQQETAAFELAKLLGVQLCSDGLPVQFKKSGSGLSVQYDGAACTIRYCEDHQCWRAFGLLVEKN